MFTYSFFLFSIQDKFLLKHVKRNKYGYVSVKLLTSFKKLKTLSQSDWKLTAYCVIKSQKLELNKSVSYIHHSLLIRIEILCDFWLAIYFSPSIRDLLILLLY